MASPALELIEPGHELFGYVTSHLVGIREADQLKLYGVEP